MSKCNNYNPDNVFKRFKVVEFPTSFVGLSTTQILDVDVDLSRSAYLKTMCEGRLMNFDEARLITASHRAFNIEIKDKHTVEQAVTLKDIPLNLETIEKVKLENSSREIAFFHVVEPLIPGIRMEPMFGTIRPKMIMTFDIIIKISCVMEFVFDICVKINNKENVMLPITGNAVEPKILIHPKNIYMARIPCYMVSYVPVTFQNFGMVKTEVEVLDTDDENIFDVYIAIGNEKQRVYEFSVEAGQSKIVYIKVRDIFRREYEMYIPFKINGLLGPPDGNPLSTELQYYIGEYEQYYENNPKVKIRPVNKDISYCRITGVITVAWIDFSVEKFEFDFVIGALSSQGGTKAKGINVSYLNFVRRIAGPLMKHIRKVSVNENTEPVIPVHFEEAPKSRFFLSRLNVIDKEISLVGMPKDAKEQQQDIPDHKLYLQMICLSTQIGNTWVWFMSDVGQFFIRITTQPRWDIPIDSLQAKVQTWPMDPCSCGESCECYRTTILMIPHQNEIMIKALRYALLEHASSTMMEIFDQLIESRTGKIILAMLLEEGGTTMTEVNHILRHSISYRITSRALLPRIDRVKLFHHTNAVLALPVTIPAKQKFEKYSVTFTSDCGMDIRNYRIFFIQMSRPQTGESSSSAKSVSIS
ncbi:hypothetical protein PYW08_000975 [Mythimna loreyi]|uniref:Uncharacterized protein n=1 Tax=Mythimna loreyi TaxID=667449 RepID=A0ACC2QZI3_9NEOP|nr:hypothetical protein PYW08_000975 [Mythimna loreyi]